MEADALFTESIVRDFILNNGGKVSNPVLVNHFKNFLNDPVRKNANRQKFKNYVNTLAVVKLDTGGSKLLVLKKKYRDDEYYFNYRDIEDKAAQQNDNEEEEEENPNESKSESSSSSTVTPSTSITPSMSKTPSTPKTPSIPNTPSTPKTPSIPATPSIPESPVFSETPKDEIIPPITPISEIPLSSTPEVKKDQCSLISEDDSLKKDSVEKMTDKNIDENKGSVGEKGEIEEVIKSPENKNNVENDEMKDDCDNVKDEIADETMVGEENEITKNDTERCYRDYDSGDSNKDNTLTKTITSSSSQSIEGLSDTLQSLSMFNNYDQSHTTSLPSINNHDDNNFTAHTETNTHDTTLTNDNKLTTQHDKTSSNSSSTSLASRNNNRESDITGSSVKLNTSVSSLNSNASKHHRSKKTADTTVTDIESMSDIDHEWLLVACSSDYHTMNKLLQSHPELASVRSVVTGYNALHWGCKHGNTDVVKLLCGKYSVDPNARTQGGYTPLHLSIIHSHQDVVELLLKVYKADASLRDYSGRTAKAYADHGVSNRTREMLNPRRMGSMLDYDQSILRHQPQYLSPVKGGKENTHPLASPISTKPFKATDYSSLMPPPSRLPPIHRGKPPSMSRNHSATSGYDGNGVGIGGSSGGRTNSVWFMDGRQNSVGALSGGGDDGGNRGVDDDGGSRGGDDDGGSMEGDNKMTCSDSEMGKVFGGLSLSSKYFSTPSVNNESLV